ncbi:MULTISPECIES: subtilase-type protease inhibitor [unclassified Streptomyces]|uniref:subtilase-type protease inhibitor n=1 Tax=unclassified Streptomyces TaxID=2593676 RepID=UPI00332FFE91
MRHRLAAVSAAALLCLGGTTGVARAEPASPSGPSALVLTLTRGDASSGTVLRAAVLSCAYTAEGTHPAPRAACDAVNATGGSFDRLLTASSGAGRPCPKRFDPVTVTADGVWQGTRVSWKHSFANPCLMSAALKDDPVFAF